MNIIINENYEIRLTQYSDQATYNLEDIVFYISKTLEQTNPFIILKTGLNEYQFSLKLEFKNNEFYNIYKVQFISNVSLRARTYTMNIVLDNTICTINNCSLNQIIYNAPAMLKMMRSTTPVMSDSDLPIDIDINTRRIQMSNNNNDNTLIAGDNKSQIISFRIPKILDDKVNIIDSAKKIYIDYKINNMILSHEVTDYQDDSLSDNYLILPWKIDNSITQYVGIVEFSISITGDDGYVWQTLPSSLSIQRGLGRDFKVPINTPTTDATYNEIVGFVENVDYVSDVDTENNTLTLIKRNQGIENETIIPMSELFDNEDGEIIFSGGGALG